MPTYQFWAHKTSGETYAIRLEGDKVTGCVGPLYREPIDWFDLEDYHYDEWLVNADWVDANQDKFRLLENPNGG